MYAILSSSKEIHRLYRGGFIELRNIPVKIICIYIYIYLYIREAGIKASREHDALSVGFTPTESPIDESEEFDLRNVS